MKPKESLFKDLQCNSLERKWLIKDPCSIIEGALF